jgi:hypothetical protein
MKLTANDQLHISSVKADNILPGEEFEVSDLQGQSLIDRGLATEVGGKKAPAPKNKKAADPANKKG